MAGVLSFLDRICSGNGVRASFVTRIPEVAVSRDKWETIARLKPAHRRAVEDLGFEWNNLWRAEQVHGNVVVQVPSEGAEGQIVEGADGLVTCGRDQVLLGIYVADCAAVYIRDCRTGALGLVHSGKKGTEQGAVLKAISKMSAEYGSDPYDLEVAVSPCIRPPRYEIDLPALLHEQLSGVGIPPRQIAISNDCTGAKIESYYSYRMEQGKTGRMLALLGQRVNNAPRG